MRRRCGPGRDGSEPGSSCIAAGDQVRTCRGEPEWAICRCCSPKPPWARPDGGGLGLLGWMLAGLDEAGRGQALGNLRATLTAHDTGHGVLYQSAAWLIRATRP